MSLSKKLLVLFASCVLAWGILALTGCSSPSPSGSSSSAADEATAETIEVTGSGATEIWGPVLDSQGNEVEGPTAHYAFTVVNNDSGRVARNVLFNVTGFDVYGNLVFEAGCSADYIYPGITTAISGESGSYSPEGVHSVITDMVVEPVLNEVEWIDTTISGNAAEHLFDIASQNSTNTDGVFNVSATITGNLTERNQVLNTTSLEEESLEAHAVVILYDEDDHIVMGTEDTSVIIDQEFLDRVSEFEKSGESWSDPDANAPVNLVASIMNVPDFKRYQLYVMPGLS